MIKKIKCRYCQLKIYPTSPRNKVCVWCSGNSNKYANYNKRASNIEEKQLVSRKNKIRRKDSRFLTMEQVRERSDKPDKETVQGPDDKEELVCRLYVSAEGYRRGRFG